MRIIADDQVKAAIRDRGGRLYVWTSVHGCCAPIVLLEAGTAPPLDRERRFDHVDAGDFDLLLDSGGRGRPQELVVTFRGRRKKIAAYWDDMAYVP